MRKRKNDFLKPDGRMILAVPIEQDDLIWNRDRVYGLIRFPLLMNGWKIIESFGLMQQNFMEHLAIMLTNQCFILHQTNRNIT
jgi:hypothetical protein